MKSILRLIYNFFKSRIFLDETIILFEHKRLIKIDSDVQLVEANENNISDVLSFESRTSFNYMTRMFLKGDKGLLGYVNGRCVHRSWVKDSKGRALLYKFLPIILQDDEVYIHDCATDPALKGKNIYPFTLSYIAEKYQSSKRILIATSENNKPSVRGILKAGFIPIEKHHLRVSLGLKKRKVEYIDK